MKISLVSMDSDHNYLATNDRGQTIQLSGSKTHVSPMESVLMAAAGCSTVDIEIILKKMRQEVSKIEVDVEGVRAEIVPKVFTKIHIHYKIFGDVKDEKAAKAIKMSMEEYCSVSLMLKKSVDITTSYAIINVSE